VNDRAESAATRLWQDRVQLREQERNEAQRQARIAQEKVAALTAENERLATENAHLAGQNDRLATEVARLGDQNDRLATEVARLRALLAPDPSSDRAQTEREMEALKDALLSLLDKQTEAQQ
jgi:predicted nuclease with TOPRIM domain